MKKIHMIAALLAMLLPTMLFANTGGSTTYYAALKAQVSSTGGGKVYASTSSSTPSSSSFGSGNTAQDSGSSSGFTFYAHAQANEGYKFKNWTGDFSSTDNPYKASVTATSTSSSTYTTKTITANFEPLPPATVTFAAPANGSYTVNGESVSAQLVKSNQAVPYSVSLVATPAANFRFGGWYILENGAKTFFSTDASTTKEFDVDATVGAEFIPDGYAVYAAVAGKGYETLAEALSEAQSGEAITAFSNVTIDGNSVVPAGTTLTLSSGVTLTVNGTLAVAGTIAGAGTITGSGTLYKISYLIDQGELQILYQADGTECSTISGTAHHAGESAHYYKTQVAVNTPSVSGGTISVSSKWGVLLNGETPYEISAQSVKGVRVNIDKTIAANKITSITGSLTSTDIQSGETGNSANWVLFSNCNLKGPARSGETTRLNFNGTIDLCGHTLTFGLARTYSDFYGVFLNGTINFTPSTDFQNGGSIFFNCSSINITKIKGTPTMLFYDCGTAASPATLTFGYQSGAHRKARFFGGYYKYSFSSGNDSSYSTVYGGAFTSDPSSYLADKDGLEVKEETLSGTKYYVVKKLLTPADAVVKIGTTIYGSLKSAIESAKNGDTIECTAAVDLAGTEVAIPSGLSITISLDGHGIKGGKIVNRGTLLFTDNATGIGATASDVSEGSVESDIDNYGTLDFVFGTYSGSIVNKTGGTLTTHNGMFTGSLTKESGTVNLKGGHFVFDVTDLATVDGCKVFHKGSLYSVCEVPNGTMYETQVSSATGYGATPYETSDHTLVKTRYFSNKSSRSDYSASDWKRLAELMAFYQLFNNNGLDPTLMFDRDVAKNSVNLYAKSGSTSVPVDFKFDVAAGNPYRALSEYLISGGYASKTFKAIFEEDIKSVAVAVTDKSGNNAGTLCKAMVELWESQKVGSSSRVTNTVYDAGHKFFVLNAGSNKAMIRPATGAATFYSTLGAAMDEAANGGTVMLANDCDTALPLNKAGTYTFDTMGFAASDAVSVSDGLFVKSETAVDSSAKVLVIEAKATTYVVATKVAQVGGTFYDNLTEAVGAANGAVVTLLAATGETITLGQGQSLKLAVASGVSYDAASKIVVDSSLTGYGIKATAADGYTLYEVVLCPVSSGDANYASIDDAVSGASGDTIAVTVTANDTETVTLPQGKTLTVTVNDGVSANVTVNPGTGAFIETETSGGTTTYVAKQITVEMSEPSSVANVEVKQIENGDTNAVNNAAAVNAAVAKLTGNGYVPRTDNTDKLDVVDKITVTPTKIVQEVVGAAAAIIRAATFDVVPTYKAGQSLGEGQKLKFRLPVDAAATQTKAVVYHGEARFGMYTVQSENDAKFIEVESSEFSPYGYELLNAFSYNDFVEALYTNNGSFNGNAAAYAGYDKDAEGRLIVLIEPTGGNWTSGSCTAEWATPYRNNGGIAQLQLFHSMVDARKGKTTTGVTDVSVQNVAFVVAGTGSGSVTGGYNSFDLSSVDAYQLYLMNNGDVTFDNCGFDGVGLAVFPPEAYAAGNVAGGYMATDNTTIIKDCSFANIYDYAIKEVNTPNYYVTDTSFENCGCAMLIHPLNQGDAGTAAFVGNTFKNVDNGSPWSDKAAGGAGTVKFDVRNAGTTLIWGNNTVENCSGVADTEYHFRNVSGNVVTELKTAMDDTHTISYVSGGVNFNTVALGQVSVNGDGTASWVAPVAKIGTTYYWTLAAAVGAASDGDVITILAGGTFEEVVGQATQFTINKSVTIDFNGKTITAIPNSGFNVQADGTVLSNGTLRVVSGSSYVVRVNGAEDVVVDSLNTYGGVNANSSTVTLANNDIHSAMYYSICSQGGSVVTVNSGTYHRVDSDGGYEGAQLIYCPGGSSLNIKGGTFQNSSNFATWNWLINGSGNVAITGGTFYFDPTDHYGVRSAWVTDNGNGTWTVVAPDPVAMIGDTPYYSLEEAVADTDGWDPIVMLTDIDLGSDVLTLDKMVSLYGAEDGETPHTLTGTVKVSAAADPEEYVQVEIVNLVFGTGSTIDVSDRGDGDEVYFTLTDVTAEAPITVVAGDLDGRKTLIDDVGDLTATDFTATLTSGYELYLTFGALQAVKWVASVNGMKFEDLADAIDVADLLDANEITILDGMTVSPNADWKVVDGKLVRKVYVAQIVIDAGTTTNKYETLETAYSAATNGDTIEMIADYRLSGAITLNKSVTLTGAVDEDGKPMYTIYGNSANYLPGGMPQLFINSPSSPVDLTFQNLNFSEFGNETGARAGYGFIYISKNSNADTHLLISNVTMTAFNCDAITAIRGDLEVVDCVIDGAEAPGVLSYGIRVGNSDIALNPTLSIVRTVIRNIANDATWAGVAIVAGASSSINVTDCTITNVSNGITAIGNNANGSATAASVTIENTLIDASSRAFDIGQSGFDGQPITPTIIAVDSGAYSGIIDIASQVAEKATIAISGGIYSSDPSAYVVDGFAAVELTEGEDYDAGYRFIVGKIAASDLVPAAGATEKEATYNFNVVVTNGTEVLKTVTGQHITVCVDDANSIADITLNDFNMANILASAVSAVGTGNENVTVDLRVSAAPASGGTVAFEVHPEAVITVGEGGSATTTTKILTNADLADGATFSFKLYTGDTFAVGTPVKVTHKSVGYEDENFYVTVADDGTGRSVSVTVSHFSTFEISAVTPEPGMVAVNFSTGIQYATLNAAITAAQDGDTIVLLTDIELSGTETVEINKVGTYTIDGNGHSITPASDCAYTHTRFKFGMDGTSYTDTKSYIVKNLTISGFTDAATYFIRAEGCSLTLEDCTITNNNLASTAGSRLFVATDADLTLDGCEIADNATASYLVDFNTNGSANGTGGTLDIDNCLFDGNTAGDTGLVYSYGSSSHGDAIKDTTFTGNAVSGAAAAVIYFSGATDVTGCLFTNNTVTATDSSQKCGVLALGSGAAGSAYTDNAFVDNTLNSSGNKATIYVGAKNVDLGGNYWGDGTAPDSGNGADLYLAKTEGVVYNTYATSYTPNAGGNGAAVATVPTATYDVWVGGTQITSANAADVFGDGKVSYDDATKTLTLNGYTYSGAGYGSSAVYIGDMGGATFNVVVAGENSLTSTAAYGYAIRSVGTGAVTVTGSGSDPSLALTVPSAYDTGYAVSVKGTSATFKDLSMAVTGYLGIVVNGNNAAGDALTIDNCDIVFDGTAIDQAIWVYNPMGDGTVSIENGSSLTGKGAILVYGYGTNAGDANLSIVDSTVNLTGATTASASGSSRHAIEVLSNVGDSVLTIDNSTVTVTASNGLHPNGNGPDGINVGSQMSANGKGLAKIDIKNGSVVTATGNANGVNLFTWGDSSNVNPCGAELSVVDSTLNASATHATGGHYGIVAYAYQKGDTSVVFEKSTVNASAPVSAGIYVGAGEDFNADVGSLSYEAIDSDVTTSGPYGLVVSTVSADGNNTTAMQTVDISGGSFTCNGLLFVYGDDGENTASVSMSDVTAQIGTTTATEEPVLGTITTGALEIDSGDYTILHGGDLDAFDVADGDISGGTFNEEVPEELCADTYIPTEQDPVTGKYTVKHGSYVAQIVRNGSVVGKYETLAEAVTAAQTGDTIQLLTDVTGPFVLGKSASITLDLNGKTLSVESGNAISVTAGELTVTSVVDDDGYATGGVVGAIAVSEGAALNIQGGIYDVDWDDCNIEGTIAVSSVNSFDEWGQIVAGSAAFTSPVPYEYCADGFIPGEYDDILIDSDWYYYVKEGSFIWKITDADGKVAYSEKYAPDAEDDEEWWEYDWFGEHEMNRNGFTMTLLRDVSADEDFSVWVSGLTYTVDLGGHTVNQQMGFGVGKCYATVTNGVISNASGTAISVANGAQVTLGDNLVISQSTTGVSVEGGTEADEYSKLTVKNGATINGTYGVLVFGSGSANPVTEVVVEGGTITGTTYGISGNGTIEGDVDYSNTQITISGGTVTGGIAGIYHPQAGELNMSSGTVSGGMAIYAKSGTISVTGGELSANGASGQYDESYAGSGPQQTGDALALDSVNYPGGNPTATISGGTFSSVNGEGVASYAATGQTAESGFVSGGIFSSEVPEEYCADGYIPREGVIETVGGVDYYTVKTGVYVAQIVRGGSVLAKYETFTNALDVAQSGDTVQLLKDIEGVTETFEFRSMNLTIDGQGYSITAGENTEPRSVIAAWGGARNMFVVQSGNVTFKDITLDGGETHYYTFLVQAKNGTTTFDNVELLHGGEADSSGTEGVGYGAAVQVDGATVLVTNSFYACTGTNENNATTGVFPFTALLYQSGVIHFYDDVTADIGDDLLLVGMVGAVDVSTPEGKAQVQEMLDAMNVPAGYYPYTLKLGDSEMTSFTGASPLGWNGIIDYGTDIMNAANTSMGMELDPDTTPVEVGLLTDTTLPETFTYEDSNLTINGNGNAISGTIEYTDDAGTMENVVMGTETAPLVLDMTGLSEGKSINLGTGISATNVTIKVTEEQATTLGQAIVTWNTEGESEEDVASLESGVKVEIVTAAGEPVLDPVTGDPMEASIIWDAEMGVAYIGPCEARLTGPTHESPIYTSLASAIARAADSGDTVTLLTNIVNYTGTQDISKSLTLDGAGHTISAAPVPANEHRNMFQAWGGSVNMFKIKAGAVTFKNITLDGDATHRYTFLISADNASASITTENVTLLHGGEQSVDSDGVTLTPGNGYGAAIHLHHGASLTVKDGFYACTGTNENGVTTGVFPFTAILPEGLDEGTSVQFDLTDDSDANPTVGIGEDLLLVGMVGAFDVSTPEDKAAVQDILDWMKVPTRFIPYTLKLNEGDVYSFSGASPRTWNEIIEYGKEIMEVSAANGFEGLNTQETPVEVGLLVDTVLPDTFTFEDPNFTVNGNGNALSGTIEYTDDAGMIENIVFGTEEAPLVLDLRNVTDPVEIGNAITVTNVTVLMTEEQAVLGQPVFTWNTETAEEPENSDLVKITVMPDAQSEPQGDEPEKGLVWDDELGLAYIGPCEARLTGPSREIPAYTSLSNAVELAAASGDTVTLMTNVTLSAQQTIDKSIVFNLNGKVLDAAGDAILVDSGAAVQMYSAGIVTGNIAVASGTLMITNGIYVGHLSKASGDGAQFVISGGHFSEAVLPAYCAEGYSPVMTTAPEYAGTPYTVARVEIIYPTGQTVEGLETIGVPIPLSWISANTVLIGSEGLVLEDLDNIVTGLGQAGTNGVPLWQSYVLGLDPNVATSQVRLEGSKATAEGYVTITGLNIHVPAILESQGTTVGFHLEETTPGSDSWTVRDDACTMAEGLPTFTVPLSTVNGKVLRIVVDIATVSK